MKRGWREPFEDCYKVDKRGCWIWQRAMMPNGYGQKWHLGKFDGAHRVSWIIHRGPLKKGVFVLHRCDVRKCVNPNHLFIGTQKENLLDMAKKERSTSKFTAAQVEEMKELRKSGSTFKDIGEAFGVRKQTVHNIVNGHTWSHIK